MERIPTNIVKNVTDAIDEGYFHKGLVEGGYKDASMEKTKINREPCPHCKSLPAKPLRDGHLLEDAERQVIEATLARFNGNKSRSGKALGVSKRCLDMKLQKWKIDDAMKAQETEKRE